MIRTTACKAMRKNGEPRCFHGMKIMVWSLATQDPQSLKADEDYVHTFLGVALGSFRPQADGHSR